LSSEQNIHSKLAYINQIFSHDTLRFEPYMKDDNLRTKFTTNPKSYIAGGIIKYTYFFILAWRFIFLTKKKVWHSQAIKKERNYKVNSSIISHKPIE
jgi:hypothetical protein